jgi:DNA-binding transcriptional LysR family regulator
MTMRALTSVDLNLLTVLGALLEERNLTRAGERLYMTQSAMSGALARLRKLLDDELLIRQGRGYELSPLAQELLPRVRHALEQADRTLTASSNFDPDTSTRTFSISISDYALTVLNRPLLQLISDRATGVTIEFDPLPSRSAELERQLMRRDLVIGSDRLQIEGEQRVIFSDRYVCIISPRDRYDRRTELSTQDLATLPYASASFGDDVQTPAEEAFETAGVIPHIAVSVTGLLSLPFLVSGTDLFAFVPEALARRCEDELSLRIVDTPLALPPLVESAHWHAVNTREAGLHWLLDLIANVQLDHVHRPTDMVDTHA